MSPLQSHKSRSSTGSLSRANSTGAALRRGELKISDPIPIPREGIDGLGPQAGVGSPDFQSTTALPRVHSERSAGGRVDTQFPHPLRSSPSTRQKSAIDRSQEPLSISYQSQGSTPNPHDSMSSALSKASVKKKRKDSTIRSVMRKIFGSKKGDKNRESTFVEHRRGVSTSQ
jgi:hypothetical protein